MIKFALPIPQICQRFGKKCFIPKDCINSNQTLKPLTERIINANQKLSPNIGIKLGKHNSIIVQLQRAEKHNALSFAMMDQLIWLAKQIQTWREVRAVILKGEGESFCSGIDLADLNHPKNLSKVAWQLVKPTLSTYQQVCLVWRELSVPVIAVLHGHCIGAGLQLVLACDIRFATPNCQFAIMESKWGLVPDMGLTQSAIGLAPDVLKTLAISARTFDAKTALQYNFVSTITETPMESAEHLVAEIAQRSPDAVLASKRIINRMYRQSSTTLYHEKLWQIKLLLGKNQKLALKKAKDPTVQFLPRQFD
ncbi:enoyl-CoA hydratase [Moraxella macacae 0408225]|uniref:Enoyl-CoA hydratase n=1 Tax=Moraxella macacae 0408225 TaxID=1230338 RepID=L2F960_9GAMM|nr:crotonase/enoyl-CoA hydratase family protein [Moraxella macacae]ELA09311.1 enoyl-CoA hydratase [Moraxella macacae 0408225]